MLIIDEADKAPTHVTAILRSLLECGHIRLPDGRVISKDDDADIKLHPDFRILALANRPGFPFLGNDFFGACKNCLNLAKSSASIYCTLAYELFTVFDCFSFFIGFPPILD